MSVNKIIILGSVGKTPEVKRLEAGTVCKFSIATSESYKNKSGEKVTNTEWHTVVCWNKLAEIVEKYVVKGMRLYVEGSIKYRSYEDKDGNKKYITEINAKEITMLSKKKDDASELPPSEDLQLEDNDKF